MKVCVLASGSSGNSIYVSRGQTRVLIDAGLVGKQIGERLISIGVDPSGLRAIVVTHEHTDHIKGVGVLARRFGIPIWMTEGTFEAAKKWFRGRERIHLFGNDETFDVDDLSFQPFALSHDAADPVNFLVMESDQVLGIATDMGMVTHLVYERLKTADFVVMETNYDRDLLMNGPYPWDLKRRISGSRGHLSNDRAAETLCRLAEDGLEHAVLAHLSDKNNQPYLAKRTCRGNLNRHGLPDLRLTVAEQDRPSAVFAV